MAGDVERQLIAEEVRALREKRGITQDELARRIGFSLSTVKNIESGYRVPTREQATLLDEVFDTAGTLRRLEVRIRAAPISPGFRPFVAAEAEARTLKTFQHTFVPGLLQTEEYIRAVVSHGRPDQIDEATERRVRLRLQRQKVLSRPGATRLWSVVDESVLHRPIGGHGALRRQIEHLLEITRQPNVTLQVVPHEMSGYAAEGSFSMLRFAEPALPDIVYIEHLGGALYLDRPNEIEQYGRVIDRLAVDAETPDRTRQLLSKFRAAL